MEGVISATQNTASKPVVPEASSIVGKSGKRATRFATDYFPTETAGLNVAYTTRIFDASVVREASRPLHSPFFA